MTTLLLSLPKTKLTIQTSWTKGKFQLGLYTSQQQELSHAKRVYHPYPPPWEEPTLIVRKPFNAQGGCTLIRSKYREQYVYV